MAKLKPSASKQLAEAASSVGQNLAAIDEDISETVEAQEEKKEKKSKLQLVNFRLDGAEYDEYKKLFGGTGLSFADGARMCLAYIKEEISDGNLKITKAGIRQNAMSKIK